MFTTLFWAECTALCTALGVAAWVRHPTRDTNLDLDRFILPVGALIFLVAAIRDAMLWLAGAAVAPNLPPALALAGAITTLGSIAWAARAWRRRPQATRPRREQGTAGVPAGDWHLKSRLGN